jgi:PleD family two-component response regulator
MAQNERHYTRPPIALIVTGQEWVALSVETLFSPRGYAVLRAFSGAQALQRISDFEPDLIVADQDLRDMRGSEFCRALREREGHALVSPVLLIATSHWTRDERLEALRAGAWDTCALPMDGEELFLRADAWVRAKLAADQARDRGLLDAATGLYNAQGLLRRIAEVAAGANRRRAPLACVVITSEPAATAAHPPESMTWTHAMAERLRAAGRASDTIGRLSENEFVVLAPDTDSAGAAGLAARLKRAIEAATDETPVPLRLRFGCYAVRDFRDASIAPSEMLIRAAEALRSHPSDEDPIRFFTPTLPGAN